MDSRAAQVPLEEILNKIQHSGAAGRTGRFFRVYVLSSCDL
jgi:hypothetical protein